MFGKIFRLSNCIFSNIDTAAFFVLTAVLCNLQIERRTDYPNNMSNPIESYKLGKIEVTITETDHQEKLKVECNDGNYRSEFTIRRYEYQNYKRHMNQRIKNAFKEQYKQEEGS